MLKGLPVSECLISILSSSRRISGEILAKKLGISRQALHKQILSLRGKGYIIPGRPKAGYRLVSEPDRILASRVLAGLKTRNFGRNLIVMETTDSTQNEAKALAEKGISEGATILAEEQTRGKGRLGRSWESGRGGLWFSIILRPSFAPQKASLIALAASLAVARAIEAAAKIRCHLKWPNDILVEAKKGKYLKVSGSLVEMSAESDRVLWVVLGVGVNVNNDLPKSLEKIGVSLCRMTGRHINRTLLLQKVLENLETAYQQLLRKGFEGLRSEYARRSVIKKGMSLQLDDSASKIKGRFVRFDEDGSLVLAVDGGRNENFFAGDVTL